MNKTIKKIVALGVTAAFLGTTVAFATAYDLSDYPSPFVKNGVFDGKIVIGEKAAAIDTVGALDIATSLQRAASTTVSGSTGGDTMVSEGIRLDNSGDRIYLGGAIAVDAVSGDDLDFLMDGEFEDDEGDTYDYTQAIEFDDDATLDFSQHGESDWDSFLAFDLSTASSSTDYFYVTKVDFTNAVNMTDDDVVGNKLELFGNEYTFSSESSGDKLVLYGSAKEVSLTTKDEVTQTVDGKEYTVKVIGFGEDSKVVVSVNGVSESIAEGNSKTVGGLKVYAKSVSSWNNGLDGFATLQLGAQKVILEDGEKVALGASEDNVDGTRVVMTVSGEEISAIYIYVNAQDSDDDYLAAGDSFTDPVYGSFKIQYVDNKFDISDSGRDMITVRPSGDSKVYAKVPTSSGDKTLYFSYDGGLSWDDNDDIFPVEGQWVPEDGYTFLAGGDPRYNHFVQVTNIDTDDTEGSVEFEDVLSGSTYKTKTGAFDTNGQWLEMVVDGKQYNVTLRDATAGSEDISVVNYDRDSGTTKYAFPEIMLPNGETFTILGNVTNIASQVAATTLIVPGSDDDGDSIAFGSLSSDIGIDYTLLNTTGGTTGVIDDVAVDGTGGYPAFLLKEEEDDGDDWNSVLIPTSFDSDGVDVGTPVFSDVGAAGMNAEGESMEDDDVNAYLDIFGTYITRNDPSGDNNVEVKIWYPGDQMYANVFITPLNAVASSSGSTGGAVALNPIAVGLAILDSEAMLGSKPYIVVGGPCVNTVAAALMGNPADCAAGFTEGKAMIKLYTAQNALLVSGYSGKDTQGACRVLGDYKTYKTKFTGTELEVITTNLNSLSVNNVA
jgi:hypothetical protein